MLRAWLDDQVAPAVAGRVLPVGEAEVGMAAGFHVPNPAPIRDALIGATAACHGLTVVTRNVADFERLGIRILDPWVG